MTRPLFRRVAAIRPLFRRWATASRPLFPEPPATACDLVAAREMVR